MAFLSRALRLSNNTSYHQLTDKEEWQYPHGKQIGLINFTGTTQSEKDDVVLTKKAVEAECPKKNEPVVEAKPVEIMEQESFFTFPQADEPLQWESGKSLESPSMAATTVTTATTATTATTGTTDEEEEVDDDVVDGQDGQSDVNVTEEELKAPSDDEQASTSETAQDEQHDFHAFEEEAPSCDQSDHIDEHSKSPENELLVQDDHEESDSDTDEEQLNALRALCSTTSIQYYINEETEEDEGRREDTDEEIIQSQCLGGTASSQYNSNEESELEEENQREDSDEELNAVQSIDYAALIQQLHDNETEQRESRREDYTASPTFCVLPPVNEPSPETSTDEEEFEATPTFCVLPPTNNAAPTPQPPADEECEVSPTINDLPETARSLSTASVPPPVVDPAPVPHGHHPLQDIRENRLQQGQCQRCGTQLFEYKKRRKGRWRRKKETVVKSLNKEGVVTRGQCVQCMMDQHAEAIEASNQTDDDVAAARPSTNNAGEAYMGSYDVFGRRAGQGELLFANGDRYVGGFHNGVLHGDGTMFFADGSEYVGCFKHNQMHGEGTRRYPDGTVYSGNFRKGEYSGQGRCYYANGDLAVGRWERNHLHGRGRYFYNNGHSFHGNFHCGFRHGGGKYSWGPQKRLDVFRYENDKRVGEGVRFDPNKRRAWTVSDGKTVARLSWDEAIRMADLLLLEDAFVSGEPVEAAVVRQDEVLGSQIHVVSID